MSSGSAATQADTKGVSITDAGPCRKKLTFEIPAEVVASTIASRFETLAETARLPGFRAGRAPRRLLERRFGAAVRDEAKQQLSVDAYQEAVEKNDLRVIGDPEGGEDLESVTLTGEEPLCFTVEVEVAPQIELPSLDGLKLLKPVKEVDDEMVNGELDRLASIEGGLENQEQSQPGDYCVGHGVMKDKDDVVVLDIDGAVIQTPKKGASQGMILGVLVDDFVKQIGLPKVGDTITIKTTGPASHENVSIRGEPIVIEYTLREVNRIIPLTREQLAEKFGFEGEQQLRENVTLRLNQRMLLDQQAAMRDQVAEHLLKTVTFDLPEKLTERQAARNLHRHRLDLMERGEDAHRIDERLAELRATTDEGASRELKFFFILDAIAREEKIEITEGEVNYRIAQMAAERGAAPEALRDELVKSGSINSVAQQIREHKALDTVVAKAEVEEIDAEKYNATREQAKES